MEPITKENFQATPEQFKQLLALSAETLYEMNNGGPESTPISHLDYAEHACDVMGLVTYNDELAFKYIPDLIDVVRAILSKEQCKYFFQSEEKMRNYLMVCGLHGIYPHLSWGTSIRVAFFCPDEEMPVDEWVGGAVGLHESGLVIDSYEAIENAFKGMVLFYEEYIEPNVAL